MLHSVLNRLLMEHIRSSRKLAARPAATLSASNSQSKKTYMESCCDVRTALKDISDPLPLEESKDGE